MRELYLFKMFVGSMAVALLLLLLAFFSCPEFKFSGVMVEQPDGSWVIEMEGK